jgi:hypothetical protein
MANKVKRYRDDNKYHASGSEHALSKFEQFLEESEIPENQKVIWRTIFKRGFDLGFQCANEYYEDKLIEEIEELTNMDNDSLKTYGKVMGLLSKFEPDYNVEKE